MDFSCSHTQNNTPVEEKQHCSMLKSKGHSDVYIALLSAPINLAIHAWSSTKLLKMYSKVR